MKVPEPVPDAQDLLDQQVDGFGGSVANSAGAEEGQEFGAPGGEGTSQPPQLGYAGVDAGHDPVVEPGCGVFAITAAVDGAQLLGGHPGGGDLTVFVAGLDASQQPRPPGVGEVFGAPAQHPPDPVERVIGAATVPLGLLLDAAAYIVDGGQSQPHDMERIQYPHGVR